MRCTSKIVASLAFVSCAWVAGCDDTSTGSSAIELRTKAKNGPVLNTAELNGVTLNGVTLNGVTLNGVTLNGVTLNGVTLNGVTLNGTSFGGTQIVDGILQEMSGTDFIGTQMTLLINGGLFVLSFNDIQLDNNNPGGDVYLYDISVYDVLNDVSSPLCTQDGDPAPAIPLRNYWDAETGDRIDDSAVVTFACRGGALAKCVDWGYRPWASGTRCDPQTNTCEQFSLTEFHQACTRMVRNDYCGDGTAYTLNGTLIDAYDRLNPNIQAEATADHPLWGVEAEWGPDGAVCAGTSLRLQHLDEQGVPYTYPPCLDELQALPDCGSFPAERGALVGNSFCGAFGTDPKSCG